MRLTDWLRKNKLFIIPVIILLLILAVATAGGILILIFLLDRNAKKTFKIEIGGFKGDPADYL